MPRQRSPYLVSAEIADAIGITQRTLENWIRTKKIQPPEHDEGGKRYKWTPYDISVLKRRLRTGELTMKSDSRRSKTSTYRLKEAS